MEAHCELVSHPPFLHLLSKGKLGRRSRCQFFHQHVLRGPSESRPGLGAGETNVSLVGDPGTDPSEQTGTSLENCSQGKGQSIMKEPH